MHRHVQPEGDLLIFPWDSGELTVDSCSCRQASWAWATAQSDDTVRWLKTARWVEDGQIWTSAGVSAGQPLLLLCLHAFSHMSCTCWLRQLTRPLVQLCVKALSRAQALTWRLRLLQSTMERTSRTMWQHMQSTMETTLTARTTHGAGSLTLQMNEVAIQKAKFL